MLQQLFFSVNIVTVLCSEYETKLQEKLFSNHNPLLRPVNRENETVNVTFGLGLHQIILMSEKDQLLKTNLFEELSWTDMQMVWNPQEYGGLSSIRVEHSKVWIPDIVLYNNADGNYEVTYKSNVVVSHDGSMLWVPITIYKSVCHVDVKYFPFDYQECELRFSSWTYSAKQLSLSYYQNRRFITLNEYMSSGSWDVIGCPGIIEYRENQTRVSMVYKIMLRRKSLFYVINLLIPVMITGLLSVIIFHLPSDGGEKITMCISVLLSISVFLVLFGRLLPHTSTIPLLSKYVFFTFFLNILTIFLTSIVININYRTFRAYTMSPLFRKLSLIFLPQLLKFGRNKDNSPTKVDSHSSRKECIHRISSAAEKLYREAIHPRLKKTCNAFNDGKDQSTHFKVNTESKINKNTFTPCSNLKSVCLKNQMKKNSFNYDDAERCSAYIAKQLDLAGKCDEVRNEWRSAASMIDLLFLVLTMLVFIIGTLSILLSSPYIFSKINAAH
ncbi:hypothetical protein GJ496_010102 [Pomphorhynchus laevis]|nr:hypothetical protein GJ496_010102 [Pomphorhynchus laevis]